LEAEVRVDVGGVGLEVAVDGDEGGPAVLLLHGWPDSHDLWRHQVRALTGAGYRTIAPDLRGFGASDKPAAVDAYAIPTLFGDVLAILDAAGVGRAHVVGHDWGAALAWATASLAPERVDHLVAMSVGHPASFGGAGLEQRQLSWYMLLFQFEGVAEQWLSMNHWANFREWAGHPEHDRVTAELSRDGALTASLSWYRANVPPEALVSEGFPLPPIQSPTMGVWSSGDMALTERQMTGSAEHVAGSWRYERIDGPGHWMQLEVPDRVNELLLDFLPRP
jgi:pimeloyl-ACP methyl ester carboxylesterase